MRTFLREVALNEAAIRERLRSARETADLTQERAADLLEVHKRTVENWENRYVPYDRISRIAEVYGVTDIWLLHGDDVEPERGTLASEVAALRGQVEQLVAMLEHHLRK